MDNREIEVAARYHHHTNHSRASVSASTHTLDWANQPHPFKVYSTLDPIPLPREVAPSGVPAFDAIGGGPPERDALQHVDLRTLTGLLYFSAGITKVKRHAGGDRFLRAAACTGALYHVDMYVACGDLEGLRAGLYHFAPDDFALRRLRDGDWRSVLVAAAGGEASAAAAPVVVALTSTFWRNSWKYEARTYRHCFWDSGTLVANLIACATAYGVPVRLLLGFADTEVNRLLDVDPGRELAVALLALGRAGTPPASPAGEPAPLHYETEPLSPSEVDYPAIHEMHAASVLASGEQVRAWRARPVRHDSRTPAGHLLPLAPLRGADLPTESIEDVIVRRGSTRRFARLPISFGQLSTTLDRATRAIPADFLAADGDRLTDLYLIVHAVDGLASGSYVYRPERRALDLLREGDFRAQAGALALGQALAADASVNVYMLCDLPAVLERFGNRGYRAAQMEGGILGGRLYLGAYAQRLGATGLTFFDDDVTAFFSPDAAGKSVMFLTALGRSARRC